MKLTPVELVALAVAFGIAGLLGGRLVERWLETLDGAARLLATVFIILALAATATTWLAQDLASAGLSTWVGYAFGVGALLTGLGVVAVGLMRARR